MSPGPGFKSVPLYSHSHALATMTVAEPGFNPLPTSAVPKRPQSHGAA